MVDDDRVVLVERTFEGDIDAVLGQERVLAFDSEDRWFIGNERNRQQIAVVPEHTVAEIELSLVDATDEVVDRTGERETYASLGTGLDLLERSDAVAGEEEYVRTNRGDGPVR